MQRAFVKRECDMHGGKLEYQARCLWLLSSRHPANGFINLILARPYEVWTPPTLLLNMFAFCEYLNDGRINVIV